MSKELAVSGEFLYVGKSDQREMDMVQERGVRSLREAPSALTWTTAAF